MRKTSFIRFFTEDSSFVRPMFVFLSLILLALYIWMVITAPALEEPWRLVLFTVLMAVHASLYWASPQVAELQRGVAAYIIGQGVLVFVITLIVREIPMVFGLYAGLVGPVFGLVRDARWKIASISYYLLLSLVSMLLVAGLGSVGEWAIIMIPVLIYIVLYVSSYIRQAEARERAQQQAKELEAANRQLAEYAAQVEDLTILAERQRMARELHDTLSQGLAGLILQLEAADAHLSGGRTEKAQDIIQQTMTRARTALADARRVIGSLRETPDTPELEDAIRREVSRFTESTGIACDLLLLHFPSHAPVEICEPALRVISEGLTNIARHARATHTSVELRGAGGWLELTIKDDGVGFDPAAVSAGHYGLVGMRERIRLAGGTFQVESTPGKGTRLAARLPCPAAKEGKR